MSKAKFPDAFLATNLMSLRKAKGLNQGDVAKQLGISRAILSASENGHRAFTDGELDMLGRIYDVNIDELRSAPIDTDPSKKSATLLLPTEARIIYAVRDQEYSKAIEILSDLKKRGVKTEEV